MSAALLTGTPGSRARVSAYPTGRDLPPATLASCSTSSCIPAAIARFAGGIPGCSRARWRAPWASPRREPSPACWRPRARCSASATTRRTRRCACACSASRRSSPRTVCSKRASRAAVARRAASALLRDTDAVRLVNAEGDGLPGLVVDRYGDAVVVKLTTAGMLVRRESLAGALRAATGAASRLRARGLGGGAQGRPARPPGRALGRAAGGPVWIRERGRRYAVDLAEGQKTGFYLDQRDARDLVQRLAAEPAGARPLLLHRRLRRCRRVRRGPAPHTGRFLQLRARARAGEPRGECSRRARANRAGRRLRVPARGRCGLRPADPGSAADGESGARRRARRARLQGPASQRACGARRRAHSCWSSPARTTSAPRSCARSSSALRSRPGAACGCWRRSAPRPITSSALDHPEGAYLSGLLLEA